MYSLQDHIIDHTSLAAFVKHRMLDNLPELTDYTSLHPSSVVKVS